MSEWVEVKDITGLGTQVLVGGMLLVSFTPETDKEAIGRFVKLVEADDWNILCICEAAKDKLEWNLANPGKGKDWPVFRQKEELVNRLLKEAGIEDN